MSGVTDEMVEAAAIARHEYRRRLSPLAISLGWYDLDPEDQAWMLAETRAALAAVAPRIAAAERERCIAVARRWSRDGQSATAHGIIIGIEERPPSAQPQEPTP